MKVIAKRRLTHGGGLYVPGQVFEHAEEGRALRDRLRAGVVVQYMAEGPLPTKPARRTKVMTAQATPEAEPAKSEADLILTTDDFPTGRRAYGRRDMKAVDE